MQRQLILFLLMVVLVGAVILIGGDPVMAEELHILVLGQFKGKVETIMINSYDPESYETHILSIPPGAIFVDGDQLLLKQPLHQTLDETDLKRVLRVLGQYLGVEIPYYLIVDYAGAQGVVDAMDGVSFRLPSPMHLPATDEEPALDLSAGKQTFDGNTARRFLRYRTGDLNGPAELQVIRLQQLFLNAMIRQLAEQKWKVIPIAFQLPKMIQTNIGLFKILDLAYGAIDLRPEVLDVEFSIIPGEFVQNGENYQYQIQGLRGFLEKND